jgi:CHAT domain-containing protein
VCVAGAWPAAEQENSGEDAAVANAFQAHGLAVKRCNGHAADLSTLANGGRPWRVLHLACHGVFRGDRRVYGLLLAANNQPPPPPVAEIAHDETDPFLATPAKLRDARLVGRLTFLSSCVSARSVAMPGDDLIGVTRALFANGALDLVAGGWTVLSSVVEEFTNAFYGGLRSGQDTATALCTARQQLAKANPDPFFWGCFILQGANTTPLKNPKP